MPNTIASHVHIFILVIVKLFHIIDNFNCELRLIFANDLQMTSIDIHNVQTEIDNTL